MNEHVILGVIPAVGRAVSRVFDIVSATIKEHKMIGSGETVICAVSGGPDSMCLLDSLLCSAKQLGFKIHVAHLHHHMRGEQADKDAELVSGFCLARGLEVSIGHEKVLELSDALGVGVEEAGRIARYAFLKKLAQSVGAQRIALGHNQNDQAETVIMRLARGAGTQGLAGIPPVNEQIIRPLIYVPRDLIEQYCEERNLPTITDKYNLDLKYTRNLVRYKVLPHLTDLLNPSLTKSLSDTAKTLRWDADYLEEQALKTYEKITSQEGRVILVDEHLLRKIPLALSSRVLEMAWRNTASSSSNLEIGHIARLLHSCSDSLTLPRDVIVHKHNEKMSFYPSAPKGFDTEIAVPGRTCLPELGIIVSTRILSDSELPEINSISAPCINRAASVNSSFMLELTAWADYNKCEGEVRVRTRRPGDRFAPLGMKGRQKKVKDLLVSMGVPRYYRSFIPLFFSGEQIIWVGGFRLSEQFKVTENTQKVLEIGIEPFLRYRQNYATI